MITKEGFVEALVIVCEGQNIKLSKDKTWKLFKGFVNSIVDQVAKDADNKISLSGIGNFEMIKASPRGTKVGVVDFVPRMRWRASTRINALLEEMTDQVPDPDKVAAKRAELEKAGKLTSNLPPRDSKKAAPKKAAAKKAATKKAAKKAPPPEPEVETDVEADEFDDDDF